MSVDFVEYVAVALYGEVQIPDGAPVRAMIVDEGGFLTVGASGNYDRVFLKILPLDGDVTISFGSTGVSETFRTESWRALPAGETLTVAA